MSTKQIFYLVDDGTTIQVVDQYDLDRSEMEVLDQGSDLERLWDDAHIQNIQKQDNPII